MSEMEKERQSIVIESYICAVGELPVLDKLFTDGESLEHLRSGTVYTVVWVVHCLISR